MKALLVTVLLLLSSTLAASQWCVCRQDASQAALQKTIDYACGSGADCNSIHETGACYNPNTVAAHCSWAANSYYQNNKAKGATCDFTGTAALTTSDPSSSGCSYPTGASAVGTMTPTTAGTMGGGTPGTSTGTGTGTGTAGAGMGTGTATGTAGTGFGGLGPGTDASMDTAAAAGLLVPPRAGGLAAALVALLLSAMVLA
uniref:Glucan endo-1,3-beta-glucosidase 3 n=1 Tax=Zea mays TaxID=4577 RepID=B6UAN6_MAIZE|nr:glucan endo-1,3-beta-glucosidase 3 precursor [Zea mays]